MFINTGGLPEQHIHRGGQQHLSQHHHGSRNLQQFTQLHQSWWSWRLAAPRHTLFPDSLHHSIISPAVLLLKFRLRQNPSLPCFSPLRLSTPLTSHPTTPPSPASRLSLSQRQQD